MISFTADEMLAITTTAGYKLTLFQLTLGSSVLKIAFSV